MRKSVDPSLYASTQLGVQYSVLRLYSWPQLSALPAEMIPEVAKVCALLAVRPTGAPLIPRLLDMPRESVTHIVEMLHLHGHLQGSLAPSQDAPAEEKEESTATHQKPNESASRSIIGRLWKRLSKQRTN